MQKMLILSILSLFISFTSHAGENGLNLLDSPKKGLRTKIENMYSYVCPRTGLHVLKQLPSDPAELRRTLSEGATARLKFLSDKKVHNNPTSSRTLRAITGELPHAPAKKRSYKKTPKEVLADALVLAQAVARLEAKSPALNRPGSRLAEMIQTGTAAAASPVFFEETDSIRQALSRASSRASNATPATRSNSVASNPRSTTPAPPAFSSIARSRSTGTLAPVAAAPRTITTALRTAVPSSRKRKQKRKRAAEKVIEAAGRDPKQSKLLGFFSS